MRRLSASLTTSGVLFGMLWRTITTVTTTLLLGCLLVTDATAFFTPQHHHPSSLRTTTTTTFRVAGDGNVEQQQQQPDDYYDVVIIGGGIVGLATGVGLCCNNNNSTCSVCILEQASCLRPIGALLGFFPNGVTALETLSPTVAAKVLACCIPYRGVHLYNASTTTAGTSDDATNQKYQEILDRTQTGRFLVWYLLQKHLAEALPAQTTTLHLNKVFESYVVDQDTGIVTVQYSDRTTTRQQIIHNVTCRVLVGADGIHSAVRTQLEQDSNEPRRKLHFHNRTMFRALLNLDQIDEAVRPPPGIAVSYRCGELGKVFAFRETAVGIVTLTATVLSKEPMVPCPNDMAKLQRLQTLFADYPPAVQHILDCVNGSAIYENAVFDVDVMERPKTKNGRFALPVICIGDAAHAMSPVLGQGANIGLEDACELSLALNWFFRQEQQQQDNNGFAGAAKTTTVAQVLDEFWKRRMERVKEVHRVSREQTVYKNTHQNSAGNTVGSFRQKNADFYERLYGWKPSSWSSFSARDDDDMPG